MPEPGAPDRRQALLGPLPFRLDPFQVTAMDALDADRSVLVAAPTGSGKTLVAEYAVARALAEGRKAFYTSPIKALSNQKYADLARRHGADRVGLLTGDNAINGDAPVVVMTTEVLRNMIYAGSPALAGLRYVVLDEVHYLQDTYRGPVWEEVIIHLPAGVDLVCLSATVSNAEELAEWISTVRGPTQAVIEETRPVELENLYLVGDRGSERLHLLPTLVEGRPNPEADRLDDERLAARGARPRGRPRRRFFTPRRDEVVDRLRDEDMLPAIVFVFSRAGCDEARDGLLDTGLRLTTVDERARIRALVDEHTAALADADLHVLGFDRFLGGLEAGIAAHHAGMVPPFKEAVEACFTEGLTKVVFATETLALGVNMPARSVVIERLTKFTGERREFLTPGEYTQLTGRAGRRGIDDIGYAVVLWSPFVPFDQVAALASSRTYALRSAFRPTYNMAANLVNRYEPARAHHLLNLSFAQFQADRAVVRLESRLERAEARGRRLREEARCERGDVEEYRDLRARADAVRREVVADHGPAAADRVLAALTRLGPGDVVVVDGARAAVLSVAFRKGHPKVHLIDERARSRVISAADLSGPLVAVGSVELPVPYNPNHRAFQHGVATALRRARVGRGRPTGDGGDLDETGRDRLDAAFRAAESHPVADCPERDVHLRSLVQADRAEREAADLRRQVKGRTGSLARRFDRVLRLLEAWGYLDGWALTEAGAVLARTYHEADLLVAEAMTSGLLDGLDPPELAGLVSCLTYEHRGRDRPPAPTFPSKRVRERWADLERLAGELRTDEAAAGLPETRLPDPGFVTLAHDWVTGVRLSDLLADEDLSGGDFVRNVRQLIDLLRQVGDVSPNPATARAARQAADGLHRGVVAASSTVEVADEGDEAAADERDDARDGTDEAGTAGARDGTDEAGTAGARDGTDEAGTAGARDGTDEAGTAGARDGTEADPGTAAGTGPTGGPRVAEGPRGEAGTAGGPADR
ncbi:MAG: DEAD/DEAH box helicase [Acidimicrobiia bacterium]